MIGMVDCARYSAVVGWIPHLLLRMVVRMQTPRSAVSLGGEEKKAMLQGEVTDSSLQA